MPTRQRDEKLKNAAAEWIAYVEPELKEVSLVRYETLLRKYILPEYGDTPVDSLADSELYRYARQLTGETAGSGDAIARGGEAGVVLSESTASSIISMLRRIRSFWLDDGKPCSYGAARSADTDACGLRILSEAEEKRLLAHLRSDGSTDAMGVWLCLDTGIKLGELCALDGGAVSGSDVMICRTVQRVQNRDYTEGSRRTRMVISYYTEGSAAYRVLPLSEELAAALREMTTEGSYMLTGEPDRHADPRTMENRLRSMLRECGIEGVNFNSLRDTYAVRRIEEGADVLSLSRSLGHSSLAVTERRYGSLWNGRSSSHKLVEEDQRRC